ncbi:MAG: DUF3302 domain-containing protein [Planctomycetaceae bacterium]
MFLEIFALVWLVIVVVLMVYIFFWIHDIPYEIAKHRNHPQRDAIHAGCWLSLFTLHAIWPLIFMWSLTHPKPGETDQKIEPTDGPHRAGDDVSRLKESLAALERKVADLERGQSVNLPPAIARADGELSPHVASHTPEGSRS